MRMHHATRFVHVDAFVQFYHERGVRMLTGWGDAVGVWCVDAHTVGTCFEMLFNHLDEFVGRPTPIVVESDIDVDVRCNFAGE